MTENNKNYSGKPIGKWDKNDDESKKQQMRAKYLENEEKRKQLAIDNLKRRKQVQKRRQEEFEAQKKAEEGQLKIRKQSQQDAYIKYLKRDSIQKGMNLYDRHEAEKKSKKEQVEEVRSTRKWGEPVIRNKSKSVEKHDDNLLALDLDVHVTKDMEKIKKFYQEGKEKLKLLEDFQKEWEESKDMLASSLLDSLDLDKDSIVNSKAMAKIDKKPLFQFQNEKEMKESVLSESLELSEADISQLQSHKQPAEPKVQVNIQKPQLPEKQKIEPKKQIPILTKQNKFTQDLKQLIGFDSLDQSSAMWHIDAFKKKYNHAPTPQPTKNQVPQQQIQSQHKKVQLLNWAPQIEQVRESGLTSNASRKPRSHILQNLNQRIKNQKANIVQQEQRLKAEKAEDKRKSLEQRREAQRRYSDLSLERARKNKSIDKSSEKSKRLSNQKLPPINPAMKGTKYSNITAPSFTSKLSKQSRMTAPVPNMPNKNKDVHKSNKNQYFQNPQTICSQDDNLHMEQFIKDDLIDLNERQLELQREIKNIHFANRNKVKSIQQKYQIETGYKNTYQLLKKQPEAEKSYDKGNKNSIQFVTQDQLQDSLLRLDDLLRKQDKKLTYLSSLPIQEQRKESEDSLRVSDSLQTQQVVNFTKKDKSSLDKNQELLTQIIKLAARNIGDDPNSIDLNKLKEQLSKMSINSRQNQQQQTSKQNITQTSNIKKETKQQPKKDSKELSYVEIMKIKAAANQQISKPDKIENKQGTLTSTQQQIKLKQMSKQQSPRQEQKSEKISVNQRLRKLLLQ